MAVKIIKRLYNEIFTDGETDWLLGNVGEWQKLRLTCEVAIDYFATQQSPVQINTIENSFELASGERWGDFGFDNGMMVTFQYTFEQDTNGDGNLNQEDTVQQTFEILNISGSSMEVSGTIESQGFETIPTNFGSKRVSEVRFFVDQDLEGCRIVYGQITNDDFESNNLSSFIDGTKAEFVFPGLQNVADGTFVNMEAVGKQSGMAIRQARVRKLIGSDQENFARWDIFPTQQEVQLFIFDAIFQNPIFFGIQSALMSINDATNAPQGYRSQTGVGIDRRVTQGSAPGVNDNGIQTQQCFLINANAPTPYNQQLFINATIRVTSTQRISAGDGSVVRIILVKYTNGTSTAVSTTVLREWADPGLLVNQQLNFNGVVNITVNNSDTYSLCAEFYRPGGYGDTTWGVNYVWESGVMIASNPNEQIQGAGGRLYEFEIQYMIPSIFDSINNFQDFQNLVFPSYLEGEGSLTDNFDVKFYPEWNNPNVIVKNELNKTARKGNTGWFNENFNQLNNDFEIESIEYFDENGNSVESLDYSSKTKVKAIISGVPNLGSNTECGFGFAWIPVDESDYQNKETPFHQNIFINSGDIENGFSLDTLYPGIYTGFGIDGASMDSEQVKFTNLNGKIVFEATFNPNSSFFSLFDQKAETDRNYIIWISVADGDLERNLSDRVSLLADFKSMIKNIPPAGEYENLQNTFIEHPYESDVIGVDEYKGLIQDDVLCRIPFKIPNDGSEVFQSMTFGVDVYNIAEGKRYELETYNQDLTQYPIFNNIQQIQVDKIRGFKTETGNNKNWVKIEREPSLDTSLLSSYVAFYAFKIRWEDWIQNPNAPVDFFDSTKENNGLNEDWIHYLRTSGWNVNFFVEIVSLKNGELVEYRNQFPFTFKDYDENQNVQVQHQYYRDSDNTLLNTGTDPITGRPLGVILSNEPTRIEISYEILDSGTWDLSNTYSVTTIEIDRGAGILEQRQLSSVWGSESDNPLKPITGETKLKMEVDGTQKILKTSCVVDPDLLEDALRYRITGRIGCGSQGIGTINGLYEFRYENTYE